MKKVFLLMLVSVMGLTAFGQTKINLRAVDKAACEQSDYTSLKASFSFSGLEAQEMQSERGVFSELSMPNTVMGGNEGDPQIPVVNQLIAVPFGAHPRIEVKSYTSTDYRLEDYGIQKLMPRQLPVRKSQRPEDVPFIYNAAAYQKAGLASAPQASVSVVGTMRGVQLGKMGIEPVSYDPVNNTLRVFNDIEVEVYFDDADAQATEDMLISTYSPYFDIVYKQLFNGRAVLDAYSSHPDLYTTPVKMLVITTSTYANSTAFQNWKNWKKQKGIYVDVQTVTSSTSSSSIRSTIQSKYNSDHPTFLVIVGDKQDVTSYETYTESGNSYNPYDSDLKYASMDNDVYHDMFMSRMPISSTTELSNLITKIMQYEQYTMPDPSYLSNVLLIAGYDATWASKVGRPTINYAADNYFNTAHGFSNVYKYVTSTYTNCYSYLSSGVGFANYTAHGDITMWYQPQFTTSNVSSLTNTNKYFWAMGNCCLAANWGYNANTPCLAEALLRAANKGAFGYIGSIPETLWYEDYYFGVGATNTFNTTPSMSATTTGVYDAMFDDNSFNTLNAVPYIGNVAVTYAHANGYTSSVDDQYYWRAYQCLGDGSVMPYHVNPTANSVSHANTLQTGATSFTVSAVAGSYVAITVNNEIIGVAQVPSSGTVNVPITAQTSAGTARIVVTRQQRQPYIQDITISGSGSTPTNYTITATANPTAGGTVTGAGSYASGSTCTLTATPATGYTFTNWTKNGTQVSTNATYSFSVTANATYVANFSQVQGGGDEPGNETQVTIGNGTSVNGYIPTYSYYKYSLSEQIYTKAEVGQAGTITAVSFKVSNSKSTTRTIDLYMKHTSATSFASATGWESLSSSNKVFSGSVTFNASGWTTITLSTPFAYNGTSNLLIGMDDNTGSYVSNSSNSPQFYVYSTSANRALRIYSDGTNYNPASPSSYSGTLVTSNNQIMLAKQASSTVVVNEYTITATANPSNGGTVTGAGTYSQGSSCTLTATPASGYEFVNWTKGGSVVSTNATYRFNVTANGTYIANFNAVQSGSASSEITIGSGTSTNKYIPTYTYYNYSLTEQIYTAAEIGQAGTITAVSFKVSNSKSTTRTVDLYLKHTSASAFTSNTGWESLSSSNKVFSGSVTFNASGWTTITLSTPFAYNGTSNLLIGLDDNTGSYISSSNSPQFYVYSTGANRALRIYNDNTNYNPASPSSYSGSYVTSNNQVMLSMNGSGSSVIVNEYTITATANPTAGGTITGAGTYTQGSTATLKATANNGYQFVNWTKNGSQVSTNPSYSFAVTGNASYVANFEQEIVTTYYNVTVASVPNGTVTANKTTAAAGETVTLTATPASGCSFDKWVVFKTGNVNSTLTVNNNKFTMPAYNVTVVALFTPAASSGGGTESLTIGSGTSNNAYIPTYAYYKYSLTEQIYTAAEIGQAGTITAIAFKVSNSKSATRCIDLYMKHTTKTAFTSKTGWESLSSSDKVFSGNVTFNSSGWTTITLSTPFAYNGTSNLLVGIDDNTGSYVSGSSNSPKFYVYSTGANRALRIYSDGTNYNPASPSSYSGTYVTSNNQITLTLATAATSSNNSEILVVTPNNMSGFTYAVGNGPSAVQSFAVIGQDLNGTVTLTAPSHYEISTSANGTFGRTLTLGGNSKSSSQTWGFEGSMDGWSTIDADGDGYNWMLASNLMSGYSVSAHGGSDMLTSESYHSASGTALSPDNWLVSPQVTLGGTFTMYACAQDANYAAEHFGIFVSTTSNTNPNSFTKLNEWTLTAKSGYKGEKGTRTTGSWYECTVDLSAYAGRTGYIAVRHFNCYDQFYLNVDDFKLTYNDTPVTPEEPTTTVGYLTANVYVRLKAGLSQGTYANETLTATTGSATGTVVLSGTVTGSKTISDEGIMGIFPNPVACGSNVRIELPANINADKATIEVFDALGRIISSKETQGESIEYNVNITTGIYTVRVIDKEGNVYYGKLVVK